MASWQVAPISQSLGAGLPVPAKGAAAPSLTDTHCHRPYLQEWGTSRLCFEYDTEPYAKQRDAAVAELAQAAGVELQMPVSHTLYVSAACLTEGAGLVAVAVGSQVKQVGQAAAAVWEHENGVGPEAIASSMSRPTGQWGIRPLFLP